MKTTFIKTAFVSAGLIAFGANATKAGLIADWTFETSLPSGTLGANSSSVNYSPEAGTQTATATCNGYHLLASSAVSSPAGNGSAHSYSLNNWSVGDYYQFQVSTLGYTTISLTWDQTSSSTGPGNFVLQYSVNGTDFNNFGSGYSVLQNGLAPNASWNATTAVSAYGESADLSSITAIENQSSVYFRLVDLNGLTPSGGAVGAGGTDRLDNFTVTAVPEPVNVALGILGASAGLVGLIRFVLQKRVSSRKTA